MKFQSSTLATGLILALVGCGGVRVTPSGKAVPAAARPPGCALEFLNSPPGRPFDELADLEIHITWQPKGGPREALHDKACQLGADAVIVTREFVLNAYGHSLVSGTAIKYRFVPPAPPPALLEKPEPPAMPETPRPPADPGDTVRL